jgi:serine/threonine-protein kinase
MLEAKHVEVEVLNDELRRQVAARSRELTDALALMGRQGQRSIELKPGDVVEERYRVVRAIGSGAVGRVYEVERAVDGQRFALKVLGGDSGFFDSTSLARLAREAALAAEIAHPNVVAVIDADVSSEGYVFVVMELVSGTTLRAASGRYGDAAWALPILHQIASGLAAIHARGIVHRDLKPANVLLSDEADGHVRAKIADFGIARERRDASESGPPTHVDPMARPASLDASLTQTGVVLGTPLYMAPEVARGADRATTRSDIFSFGVIAYELLTGKRPHGEVWFAQLGASADPLATKVPDLPRAITTTLDRCLSVEPAARPSAEELVKTLAMLPVFSGS